MRRINIIDAAIILIVLFSFYSFITHEPTVNEQVDEYYYSGSQIYKATNYMNYLDSKGFLYDTYVKGYWLSDYLEFDETGYVIDTGQGSFILLRSNGELVTIGGRMSYKEQIGANEIRLKIKTKSTVSYRMYAQGFPGLENYFATIEDTASFLDIFDIDDIAITSSITFDYGESPTAVFIAEVNDALRKGLYYVKDASITDTQNGLTISFTQASIKELAKMENILNEYGITIGNVFSSDIITIVRTGTEIGELDKYWIKQHITDNLSSIVDDDENSIHIRL